MTDHVNRVPSGVPTGGQFAASTRAEAAVTLGEPAPLSAAEFAVASKTSQALRALHPAETITLPDGSKAGVTVSVESGDDYGDFVISHRDHTTTVHTFNDLGERGSVADRLAFETTYAARDTEPDTGPHCYVCNRATDHVAEHDDLVENGLARYENGSVVKTDGWDDDVAAQVTAVAVHADPPVVTDPAVDGADVFPPGTVRHGNGRATGPDGKIYVDVPGDFWHGTEYISTYTRAQALSDGFLRDHSKMAKEAGIAWPVALTAAAHADTVSWSDDNAAYQDEEGRAWDVIWMASLAIKRRARQSDSISAGDRIPFEMIRVPNTPRAQQPRKVTLHAVLSPDETGQPCWTIMQANESGEGRR